MILQFRNLRFAISALYVVLFLAVVSVPAQDAGDNPRTEPAAKAKTEEKAVTAISAGLAISTNATEEKKAATGTAGDAAAPSVQGSSDKWHFTVAPYLWLAGLKGTIGAGDITTDIDPGVSDILNSLNFGFMGAVEARKNKFMLINDLMYISLEKTKDTTGPLFSSLKANAKVFMLSPVVGYRLAEGKGASLDAIAGIRFWHTSTRLELAPKAAAGKIGESSKNWADVIGGLRGQVHVSKAFSLIGRGDFGGGGSDFSYQLFGGVGIDVSEKTSLFVAYRYLYFKYTRGNSLFDGALNGVVLGAAFRF